LGHEPCIFQEIDVQDAVVPTTKRLKRSQILEEEGSMRLSEQ